MYVIREKEEYCFVHGIKKGTVLTTKELTEAMIFEKIEKAEKFYEYLILNNDDYY